MTRQSLFALMAIGLLSACANGTLITPPYQPGYDPDLTNSIGFTGIGAEPF